MEREYNFDRQKIMDTYNGKRKNDSWSDEYTNEVDAIQETFNFLTGDDLKRAGDIFNLALKYVNGNAYVKVEGSYAEYTEKRNTFFEELGFEVKGNKLEEADRGMER